MAVREGSGGPVRPPRRAVVGVLGVLGVLVLLGLTAWFAPGSPTSHAAKLPTEAAQGPLAGAGFATSSPSAPLMKASAQASVRRALDPLVPYLGSAIQRPHATGPGLPNLTGNITGFTLSPLIFSISGNTGLEFVSNITALPSGANSSTFVFSLLGESVSTNRTAFVGYFEGSFYSVTAALPVYLVLNGTNLSSCGLGGLNEAMYPGASTYQFSFQQDHGYWWNFLWDGQPITGGSSLIGGSLCPGGGNANGTATADLYSASASLVVVPIFTWLLTANVSGIHPITVQTVCEYLSGTTWSQAPLGLVALDSVVGVAGYLQDPTIPPDTVIGGPGRAVLATLTTLWDTGPLPSLAMTIQGVQPSDYSGQPMPLTVWVNDSSTHAGVATASLTATSSNGGTFLPGPSGPSVGEFHLTYEAPAGVNIHMDNLTLLASNTGYVAVRNTYSVAINAAPLTVTSTAPSGPVFSGQLVNLSFWVKTIFNTLPTNLTATASVAGGGSARVVPGAGANGGLYPVGFTAPLFLRPSLSTITFTVSGPGYVTASSSLTLRVEPRPLELSGPVGGSVWAGSSVNYALSLATPVGALPLAVVTWWNVSVRNSSSTGALSSLPLLTQQGGSADLHVSVNPLYLGPIWFWVNVSAPGFNATQTIWWENSTANLSFQLQGLPSVLHAGDRDTLTLQVSGVGGAPVYDAEVVWTSNVGGFGSNGGTVATAYTDANGRSVVTFVAPAVSADTYLQIEASVVAPYYVPSSVNTTATLSSGASSSALQGDQSVAIVDLLLVVLLLGLLLALFAESRSRHARAGRGGAVAAAAGVGAARSWASTPDDEGGGEGKAPWPGPSSARYEEEELGASDRPPETPASKTPSSKRKSASKSGESEGSAEPGTSSPASEPDETSASEGSSKTGDSEKEEPSTNDANPSGPSEP